MFILLKRLSKQTWWRVKKAIQEQIWKRKILQQPKCGIYCKFKKSLQWF